MARASDSGRQWASDSAGSARWAQDSDWRTGQASDSRTLGLGRAWGASEENQTLIQNQMLTSGLGALGQAAKLFCGAKTAEGLSPRSITWYRMILDRLIGRLGADRPVDGITLPELRAWLVGLRSSLAPISVAGYVRGLRAVGNWLAVDGLAEARAFRTLARPRVPHKVIEPLSDGDLRRLLAACGPRDRAILLLLLDTGLRVSEAAGIRLRDLRPDGTIKVMGKGAKERIVPVGSAARTAIIRYLERRGDAGPDAPLFLGQSGEALTLHGIQQLLERLKDRVGVTGRCSPHTFRHTFARSYLVNGGDVFTLQRILGHTSLEMVRRYVALSDTDVANRHRAASPADRLVGPKRRAAGAGAESTDAPPARATGQASRSTGEAFRWTARRSSSSRST